MKKKIQDALELAYKDKLGLTDKKVYARVAALGETYVASDEDIPAFVEKAEDILKGFQGVADQGRTLETANSKIAELEAKLKALENKGDDGGDPNDPTKKVDWQATLQEAIKNAVAPLTAEIAALKSSSSAKEALASAHDTFFGGDYAKKYKEQAEDAWAYAVDMNEATGSKMTADELNTKATEFFNRSVARLGVDTSKPFPADSSVNDKEGTTDWSAERERLIAEGRIAPDKK